jgi:hypothetical protein
MLLDRIIQNGIDFVKEGGMNPGESDGYDASKMRIRCETAVNQDR